MTLVRQTQRLDVRHLEPDDAPFMLELLNDPDWLRYIGDRGVRTTSEARTYLENGAIRSYREHGFGLYCVVRRDTGASTGICGLVRRPGLDDVDLGFAFLPAYRSLGVLPSIR